MLRASGEERARMIIITISWQLGTGGERVGALVGERLGVPVVDKQAVEGIMHALHTGAATAAELERFVPTWQALMAVSLLTTVGMPGARAELIRAERAHAAVEQVLREAARQSCVIMGRGAFALLHDHPGACHVRLTAPFPWRVGRVSACDCLPAEVARRRVAADDRTREEFVRHYYHRRLDDPGNFHLVLAADRFGVDQLVDIVLAAAPGAAGTGGIPVAQPAVA
jgi:hypothetical protein